MQIKIAGMKNWNNVFSPQACGVRTCFEKVLS